MRHGICCGADRSEAAALDVEGGSMAGEASMMEHILCRALSVCVAHPTSRSEIVAALCGRVTPTPRGLSLGAVNRGRASSSHGSDDGSVLCTPVW